MLECQVIGGIILGHEWVKVPGFDDNFVGSFNFKLFIYLLGIYYLYLYNSVRIS